MTTRSLILPPIERQNLTLLEAAAQLAISPNHLDLSRCPHAWRTSYRGEWRVPWCCVASYGEEHEKRLMIGSQRRDERGC